MEKKKNPFIYAVDFDGTLCDECYPGIGRAHNHIIDWLIMQKRMGAFLILWTMREGERLQEAVAWCAEHGLVFDAVNDNAPFMIEWFGCNPRKVFANYYLDDHNL